MALTGSGTADVAATLALADWRRRIGSLYADVRRLGANDPAAALELWRTTRERLYREHPQSPVPADRRASFRAHHFAHDPDLRFVLAVEPLDPGKRRVDESDAAGTAMDADGATGAGRVAGLDFGAGPLGSTDAAAVVELPVSAGGAMSFRRFGAVTVPFAAGPRRLELFWMAGYAGGLFLPFRDATNGSETYGAGRYLLDAAKSADLGGDRDAGTLVIDFNFSFQPSCAFDPRWACPLAPPSNRLDLPVRAGERLA